MSLWKEDEKSFLLQDPSNMSSIENYIHNLLNIIPATSEGIYQWFSSQRLTFHDRKRWGFPVHDDNNPDDVNVSSLQKFAGSTDPKKQVCRCGKPVSLLKKDWYIDDAGCCYHWGKQTPPDGPDKGAYTCCQRKSKQNGCMHHKYHACAYKPVEKNSFVQADKKSDERFDTSNIFALDSEMVYTTAGLEVARVTLLSITGEVVHDLYIQPENQILDYNTPFSGVKPEDLNGIITTLADAQGYLLKVLNQDSILIGHGLENDLIGVHLYHDKIVDTSIIFRHERGFPFRHSLKTLSLSYLNKVIHSDMSGHNSIEDSRICIALMLKRLYLQSLSPYFNYPGSKIFSSLPSLQQPVQGSYSFIFNHFPSSNYNINPIPFINGQSIIIPKFYQFAQHFPLTLPAIMTYNARIHFLLMKSINTSN